MPLRLPTVFRITHILVQVLASGMPHLNLGASSLHLSRHSEAPDSAEAKAFSDNPLYLSASKHRWKKQVSSILNHSMSTNEHSMDADAIAGDGRAQERPARAQRDKRDHGAQEVQGNNRRAAGGNQNCASGA